MSAARGSGAASDARFSERLRLGCEARWNAAVNHRFVDELAAGTLADGPFRSYLVQDYAFIETLVTVLGFAVARAPDMATKKRWVAFLSVLTSEENDYFHRAFDALGVPEAERGNQPLAPVTASLRRCMLDAASAGSYAEVLAVVVPAEWIYLSWASARRDAQPSQARYREWIELHAVPEFEDFVGWLRAELDAEGEALDAAARETVSRRFRELVELEVAFFDQAYGV
jgi:thiaminase/transcriptional activator TenA